MALMWHGHTASAYLERDAREKIVKSCLIVELAVKASMKLGGRTESGMISRSLIRYKRGSRAGEVRTSRKGVPSIRQRDAVTGGKVQKINSFRSQPFEVPRVQTGTLKRSITHEIHPALPIGRVGTNVVYGKHLEFGTRRMKPRPFMRPALLKTQALIGSIWHEPMSETLI